MALVLVPLTGFETKLKFRTRFDHDGFREFHPKAFLARPYSHSRKTALDRISGFPFDETEGLLRKASIELDEPVSRHPALRSVVKNAAG